MYTGSPFSLLSGDTAEISASGTWSVMSPPNRQGPGGDGIAAAGNYLLPGASEGCLVMNITNGNGVFTKDAFTSDTEVKHIIGPSTLSFITNDELNAGGSKGYNDNSGSLTVKAVIKTHRGNKNVYKGWTTIEDVNE